MSFSWCFSLVWGSGVLLGLFDCCLVWLFFLLASTLVNYKKVNIVGPNFNFKLVVLALQCEVK